jgi:hypothetical protein
VRVPGSSVTVTAQKEPADPATLPVSVSTVQEDLIKASGITFVSDAGNLLAQHVLHRSSRPAS